LLAEFPSGLPIVLVGTTVNEQRRTVKTGDGRVIPPLTYGSVVPQTS
jgi:hypothetical protein